MNDRLVELDRIVPPSGLLGYLNFSQGRPDPRWQRQFADAFAFAAEPGRFDAPPWEVLHRWLGDRLQSLQASGGAAFQDVSQARAVLDLLFDRLPPAYRQHHRDLLAHQRDQDLFQPFFLARAAEAILLQGPPWAEERRVIDGALRHLNDYLGYRPIAVLETRRGAKDDRGRGEPYNHERVRPVPLFMRGAGIAPGRYRDLIAQALEIVAAVDPSLAHEAHFDLNLLDELAFDPRAFDHAHPVNRRPNYLFGEWDAHHIDNQGRYRRFVVRQVTLDGMLDRVASEVPGSSRSELLYEAAAVLAGTMLMASGISGWGPGAHDSGATLASLMPNIARYREAFYTGLLGRLSGSHGERMRAESRALRQPFGGARQHLNHYLSRHRARQMQQRHLALIFAYMGYADASLEEASRIPAASVRMLSEVLGRVASAHLQIEHGELDKTSALLVECEDLIRRGIGCGAFADPWNILGFQGLFPLSPAREESVRDTRIDDLVQMVQQTLSCYGRLLSEAAAVGNARLVEEARPAMRRLAAWWDQFASVEVSEVRRVSGEEAASSAEHVATALAHWHERGEATADVAFWRQHIEGFRSPKAFALVVDALLRKRDYKASMALLMSWLSQAEQAPLEDGEHSFHALALRWMLGVTAESAPSPPTPLPPGERGEMAPLSPGGRGVGGEGELPSWPLIVKFFDHLEANADEYWVVPSITAETLPMPEEVEERDELFSAAYEDVTFRDSTDDDEDSSVADGGASGAEFVLESIGENVARRLTFLSAVARLWLLAARQPANAAVAEGRAETLAEWLATTRRMHGELLDLLDGLQECRIPEPLGSQDSLIEYDRRRLLKEQLLYAAVSGCLDMFLAVGGLNAAVGTPAEQQAHDSNARPAWEPLVLGLEQAFLRGDADEARRVLPRFLDEFRNEPLLFVPLSEGGQPRYVLRARTAQTILRALTATLPRLGLLRETFHLLKTAWTMEQGQSVGGRGVTEFNHLFQTGFQAVVECIVDSAEHWRGESEEAEDRHLVELLEAVTGPFLHLWVDHSRSMQLSALEALRTDEEWNGLREFIRWYGNDLFQARFMTLGNLRGIVHRGVGAYLDYLAENPDPLHPVKLIDDLETGLPRERAVRYLQLAMQAVVENYEEYKDYNTTVARSDYGENLYLLLDFLRLKASYDRHAWQIRPLVLAHEVLAHKGRTTAAMLWQEQVSQATRELAEEHLKGLAALQQGHGVRLGTISDRLQERFVRPLALDRLCALVEPAMEEARRPPPHPEFDQLREELRDWTSDPTGVGLDVPAWLRRMEAEVQRVRATQSTLAALAETLFQWPERLLSPEDVRRQLDEWDRPLGEA